MKERQQAMEKELSYLRLALQTQDTTIPTIVETTIESPPEEQNTQTNTTNLEPQNTNQNEHDETINDQEDNQDPVIENKQNVNETRDNYVDLVAPRTAEPAMADALVPVSPERCGLSEPLNRGRAETPLDHETANTRYPRRETVKASGAKGSAAGRD